MILHATLQEELFGNQEFLCPVVQTPQHYQLNLLMRLQVLIKHG